MMPEQNNLTVARVSDAMALEALGETWNALLASNATQTVELSYEWQMTYWKYFGGDSELFVLLVRDGQAVIAIAPLKLTRRRTFGVSIRELRFIADKESNYQDFVIGRDRQAVLEAIAGYLKAHRSDWDVLCFARLPAESETCHWAESAFQGWAKSRVADVHQLVSAQCGFDWEAYSAANRKKRKYVAKCRRRLEQSGPLTYFHCETQAQVGQWLEVLFALHRNRWNPTSTPSQFNDSQSCDFYREVSPALFEKGALDLFVLLVGTMPAAILYSFVLGESVLLQLEAYNARFSPGSPGIVAIETYVEAMSRSRRTTEFELGFYYPYKETWGNQTTFRKNLECYSTSRLAACYVFAVRQLANSTRLRPVTDVVRQIRQRIKGWLWKHRHRGIDSQAEMVFEG